MEKPKEDSELSSQSGPSDGSDATSDTTAASDSSSKGILNKKSKLKEETA